MHNLFFSIEFVRCLLANFEYCKAILKIWYKSMSIALGSVKVGLVCKTPTRFMLPAAAADTAASWTAHLTTIIPSLGARVKEDKGKQKKKQEEH